MNHGPAGAGVLLLASGLDAVVHWKGFFRVAYYIPYVTASVATLAVWIFLMYKAYNREHFKIPVIGDLAEKQA